MPDRFARAGAAADDTSRRRHAALLVPTILFADASEEYRSMARDALLEGRSPAELRFAVDGNDLLDYLNSRGAHSDAISAPRPALIVLDLGLPKVDGIEAVRTIKSNPALRRIPIVALAEDDDPAVVARAYDAGVNTYLVKPVTFLALVKLMKVFTAYWLDTAELPPPETP
jgi:two-component system response regulator